jgi:hypothetical protein
MLLVYQNAVTRACGSAKASCTSTLAVGGSNFPAVGKSALCSESGAYDLFVSCAEDELKLAGCAGHEQLPSGIRSLSAQCAAMFKMSGG